MLKALIKKQIMEISRVFFIDQKKGKAKSKGAVIAYIILFAVLMVMIGFIFFLPSKILCEPLVSLDMSWFYFTIMSVIAIALGTFGSVFNTFASLFNAKDNELLLSLPIPPSKILASRLFGVYFWGFIYEAIVMIPAIIGYIVNGGHIVKQMGRNSEIIKTTVYTIIMTVALSFFILTLSCLIGWIVAKISSKLKNKSFITVIASLAFIAAYYFVYFKAISSLETILANAGRIGEKVRGNAYPLYVLGKACAGDTAYLLITLLIIFAAFTLVYMWLSHTFISMATYGGADTKSKQPAKSGKLKNADSALVSRELRRFLASPIYMLNCALSTVIIPIASVAMLVKGDTLKAYLGQLSAMLNIPGEFTSLMLITAVCAIACMNDISAPSISLEGKTLWLLQSLPITPWQVLKAKIKLHLYLTSIPVLMFSAASRIVFDLTPIGTILVFITPQLFVLLSAVFGLTVNLLIPNLTWTNETVPIKQSASVLISMFGGWVLIAALGFIYTRIDDIVSISAFLSLCTALIAVLDFAIIYWLRTKGGKIFTRL